MGEKLAAGIKAGPPTGAGVWPGFQHDSCKATPAETFLKTMILTLRRPLKGLKP